MRKNWTIFILKNYLKNYFDFLFGKVS